MKRFRILAPLLPSAAVAIGMYWMSSAWITLVLYHAGMVACLLGSGRRDLLGLVLRGRSRLAFPVILVSACGGLVFLLCWPWMTDDTAGLGTELARLGLSGAGWWTFMIYWATVHPVLEEVYWRGWLAPTTARLHWQDVAFAAYHALTLSFFIRGPWILVSILALTVAAWTWRWMARSWKGLAVPVSSHLAADMSLMVAAHLLLQQ